MKITVKQYKNEAIWSNDIENQQIDETNIDDAFQAFKGLLVTCGWYPETVDNYIVEWASLIESDKNSDQKKENLQMWMW